MRKGDVVRVPNSTHTATVTCVIKTPINDTVLLVDLAGGLRVTPWHPIRVPVAASASASSTSASTHASASTSKFVFPADVAPFRAYTREQCPAVYSFLLDSHHTMSINGVECVSFAHGFQDDAITSHPFFGTQAIVHDLQRGAPHAFKQGLVTVDGHMITRHPVTRHIVSLFGFGE